MAENTNPQEPDVVRLAHLVLQEARDREKHLLAECSGCNRAEVSFLRRVKELAKEVSGG